MMNSNICVALAVVLSLLVIAVLVINLASSIHSDIAM